MAGTPSRVRTVLVVDGWPSPCPPRNSPVSVSSVTIASTSAKMASRSCADRDSRYCGSCRISRMYFMSMLLLGRVQSGRQDAGELGGERGGRGTEAAVVAREDGGRHAEAPGHREGRAGGRLAGPPLPGRGHHPSRRAEQRGVVGVLP